MILKVPEEFYFKRIPLLQDLILTSHFRHCTTWNLNRRSVTTWLPFCILLEYQLTQSFYFGPLLLLIGRSCFTYYQNTRRACRKLFCEWMIKNIKTVFTYMRLLYWTGWVMEAREFLQILPIVKAVQAHQACWNVILLCKCTEKCNSQSLRTVYGCHKSAQFSAVIILDKVFILIQANASTSVYFLLSSQ